MTMSATQKGALGAGIGIAATIITDVILRYAVDATPTQDPTTKEISLPVLYEYAPLFAALGGGLGVGISWLTMGKEAGVPAIVGAAGASAAIGIDSWIVVVKAKKMTEDALDSTLDPTAECPTGQHKDATTGECVEGDGSLRGLRGGMFDYARLAAAVRQANSGARVPTAAGVRV